MRIERTEAGAVVVQICDTYYAPQNSNNVCLFRTGALPVIGTRAGITGRLQTPRPSAKTPKPAKPSTPEPAPEATPKVWSQRENIKVEPVDVKLARGGKVVISSRAGNIIVTGWDKDTVQASASSDSGPEPIETQTTGDAAHPRLLLTASTPSGRRFGREVRLEVKVPRYSDIETLDGQRGDIVISDVEGTTVINTGNGDVKVMRVGPLKVSRRSGDLTARDVKGDLTARSFTGEIVVENVTGLVDVAATNGDLTIHNGGGDVRANSAMGSIEIRCAKGRAEVSSASGSITLTGVGGDADASTASGEVIFTGLLRANGNYRLKSLSGEVLMTIQPDAPGFTATLSTYSGGLDTDFPLKVENPVQRGPDQSTTDRSVRRWASQDRARFVQRNGQDRQGNSGSAQDL